MNAEEAKKRLLSMWDNIAQDRSLQVALRLKASEYMAKAVGLIGNEPGISMTQEEDAVENQLAKLTRKELEALARLDEKKPEPVPLPSKNAEKTETAKKTTAQEPAEAQPKSKNDTTPAQEQKTQPAGSKAPITQNAEKGVQK